MAWTHFYDMCSGGGQKEKWSHIYIEAPEEQAKVIFYNRFGHNPERVTCTCCGSDYSISDDEGEDLEQFTGYHRNLRSTINNETRQQKYASWDDPIPDGWSASSYSYKSGKELSLEEYLENPDVLAIYDKDIKPEERIGTVPEQGYVWMD